MGSPSSLPAVFKQLPQSQALKPESEYHIISYAQAGQYTLVAWEVRQAGSTEAIAGEILYRGQQQIASSGGQLDLRGPEVNTKPSQTSAVRQTLWDVVDRTAGNYGVPVADAKRLRDPANTYWL